MQLVLGWSFVTTKNVKFTSRGITRVSFFYGNPFHSPILEINIYQRIKKSRVWLTVLLLLSWSCHACLSSQCTTSVYDNLLQAAVDSSPGHPCKLTCRAPLGRACKKWRSFALSTHFSNQTHLHVCGSGPKILSRMKGVNKKFGSKSESRAQEALFLVSAVLPHSLRSRHWHRVAGDGGYRHTLSEGWDSPACVHRLTLAPVGLT